MRTLLVDAPSAELRFTSIGCPTNGVTLSVVWDDEAFASPPFLEFFARTNLVAGDWEIVGWAQAEVGETNLDVVVESNRLPSGSPPAAFFSVVASDGLGGDWSDDDRDGVPNAVERARGTNPRRADTDSDPERVDANNPDRDQDTLLDVGEVSGCWGYRTETNRRDSFDLRYTIDASYASYGDEEAQARHAEEENLDVSYSPERDWCNPGCNSEVRRGPMTDELQRAR